LTTLVVSDLHLGARTRIDLLRRADLRAPLLRAVEQADEVVLLGDVLELRHGPAREGLDAGAAFFAELGDALGDKRVTIVPGNHDHAIVAPWLERRRRGSPPERLGLQETTTPEQASDIAREIGERLGSRTTLEVAYPGVWLSDRVYALHGHYLDRHTTVPAYERIGAAVVERFVRPVPDPLAKADDYEAILAPMYALLYTAAQYVPDEAGAAHNGISIRVWQGLGGAGGGRKSLGYAALSAIVPASVALLNRAGLGPLSPQLTGTALRAASLEAMGEVVRHLEIDADHVVFGHTHRAGPFARDDLADWTAGSTRFVNTGSWTYEPAFLSPTPNESPYWPGTCVVVEDGRPPELRRLLGYRTHEDLWDPAPPA
jgi:predicted phosphodiesterase